MISLSTPVVIPRQLASGIVDSKNRNRSDSRVSTYPQTSYEYHYVRASPGNITILSES
jgi:hypothetical protein